MEDNTKNDMDDTIVQVIEANKENTKNDMDDTTVQVIEANKEDTSHYGAGNLSFAADKRLDMNFNEKQMECFMAVGERALTEIYWDHRQIKNVGIETSERHEA